VTGLLIIVPALIVVIEAKDEAGGQPQFLYAEKKIVDIPAFPDGITGQELSERTYRQAVGALVQFRFQEELVTIEDTALEEKADPLKKVITTRGAYLCRKVIVAFGLLHFPRKLPVLDALDSKRVFYKVPRINDYHGERVMVVGGGDSALDAAVMVLQRNGLVDLIVREANPIGKADTLGRVRELGGTIRTSTEIAAARLVEGTIEATLSGGEVVAADEVLVQIGFLSARDTFVRLGLRLNEDGSIAIDPYYETSRRGWRRTRRHQADYRGLGRRNPGRDLRLQGDHQPILVERETAPRLQAGSHGRKNEPRRCPPWSPRSRAGGEVGNLLACLVLGTTRSRAPRSAAHISSGFSPFPPDSSFGPGTRYYRSARGESETRTAGPP